jgi:hypothetical protein
LQCYYCTQPGGLVGWNGCVGVVRPIELGPRGKFRY